MLWLLRRMRASGSLVLVWVSLLRGRPIQLAWALRPPPPTLVVRAVLGSEALLGRPRLDQRPVAREALLRQQPLPIGQSQHLDEYALHHLVLQQSVALLGEGRVIPRRVVDGQAHEPAQQQVVAQLLPHLLLAADRIEHLQQQRPDQSLRRNRV